jgi:hypothetical protein
LRNPIQRYISQYQYWIEKLGKKLTFEEFLSLERTHNFQTKKIAGYADIELARDILADRFFLVGTVEDFDHFLILLKKKLEPFKFRPGYHVQNVSSRESIIHRNFTQKLDKYYDQILKVNQLDMILYKYVKGELIPKEKKQYGPGFDNCVTAFKKENRGYSKKFLRYADYVLRKCYYDPVFGFIRKINGLPAKGSY